MLLSKSRTLLPLGQGQFFPRTPAQAAGVCPVLPLPPRGFTLCSVLPGERRRMELGEGGGRRWRDGLGVPWLNFLSSFVLYIFLLWNLQ